MKYILVIDVESIGLHGQSYAVGGCVIDLDTGEIDEASAFRYACNPEGAVGRPDDRKWVLDNIPPITATHSKPEGVLKSFWWQWASLKEKFKGLAMAAECQWPVEANFLEAGVKEDEDERCFAGPYPLHEIASFMEAAGMDPMATYERTGNELPKHDPLADARQSARLLYEALQKFKNG